MKSKKRKKIEQVNSYVSAIGQFYRDYASSLHITYYDLMLFHALLSEEIPLSQKQICSLLSLSKTTVSSLIRRWSDKGYLTFETSPDNHREKRVILTSEGVLYARDIIYPLFEIEEEAVNPIDDDNLKTLQKILGKYHKRLRRAFERNNV